MKILLTGATGQIATALAQQLRAEATVVATSRAMLDMSRPKTIPSIFDQIAPDLAINAAAYTAVDRAEEEPQLAGIVNATAPGVMARWAAERNVPLIHFSSDYVFAGSGNRPHSEEDATAPLSTYGSTKLEGERLVIGHGGAHLIIRTSWVYAAQGNNFLRTIARLAQNNEDLRVVADQIGAPTSAALVAAVVRVMLAEGLEAFVARAKQAGGVVHLAAGGKTSWYGFASEIVDGLQARGVPLAVQRIIPIATGDFPALAKRPANSCLDLTRLQAVFGITPPQWRETLRPELDALARELAEKKLRDCPHAD